MWSAVQRLGWDLVSIVGERVPIHCRLQTQKDRYRMKTTVEAKRSPDSRTDRPSPTRHEVKTAQHYLAGDLKTPIEPCRGHKFDPDGVCACGKDWEENRLLPTVCTLLLARFQELEDIDEAIRAGLAEAKASRNRAWDAVTERNKDIKVLRKEVARLRELVKPDEKEAPSDPTG